MEIRRFNFFQFVWPHFFARMNELANPNPLFHTGHKNNPKTYENQQTARNICKKCNETTRVCNEKYENKITKIRKNRQNHVLKSKSSTLTIKRVFFILKNCKQGPNLKSRRNSKTNRCLKRNHFDPCATGAQFTQSWNWEALLRNAFELYLNW